MWAVVKTHTDTMGMSGEPPKVVVDVYGDEDKACCAMREMFCDAVKEMGDHLEYCEFRTNGIYTPLDARVHGERDVVVIAVKRIP